MITLRRDNDRHYERRGEQEIWRSFDANDQLDPAIEGFGILELLDESRLPPGAQGPRTTPRDAEIVTYVRDGMLACDDSQGHSGIISAGEFEHIIVGRRVRHNEANASPSDWAQVFQMWLRPVAAGLVYSREQRRFSVGERRRVLFIVASKDARGDRLRLDQDATVHSTILSPGQHVVHEIAAGRSVWLHVVQGEVVVADVVLTTGDGVGVHDERSVSLTARESSELLVLDLAGHPRAPVEH